MIVCHDTVYIFYFLIPISLYPLFPFMLWHPFTQLRNTVSSATPNPYSIFPLQSITLRVLFLYIIEEKSTPRSLPASSLTRRVAGCRRISWLQQRARAWLPVFRRIRKSTLRGAVGTSLVRGPQSERSRI